MARPMRCRRLCRDSGEIRFAPADGAGAETALLTKDEFEALRLVDYEGLTHEQCAARMQISRTTVTEMCEAARRKLVGALVHNHEIMVTGGHTRLCDGSAPCRMERGCWRCPEETGVTRQEGDTNMRIAVTYEDGQVFQHFGHTEQFKIYDVSDGKILGGQVVDTQGQGHGALTGALARYGVDTLICGGIGLHAQTALSEAGIRIYAGVQGPADDAAQALAEGRLDYHPAADCGHHEHHDHHGECGEGGCAHTGGHSCHKQ